MRVTRSVALALPAALAWLAACSGPLPLSAEPNATLTAPVVSASPEPGPFSGTARVTLRADEPSTVFATVDGSDPLVESAARLTGPSPLVVQLDRTTTLRYAARAGARTSEARSGEWVRVGGAPGNISGVVAVGAFATGMDLAVTLDGEVRPLGRVAAPTELLFLYEGLDAGTYVLSAMADRSGDGAFDPFQDLVAPAQRVTIDPADPAQASAEGVRLRLGASDTGLGTLRGTVTVPRPPPGQALRISALSPDALTAGMSGRDAGSLLALLQNGDQLLTSPERSEYPYVITNLDPGQYVPAPSLLGLGPMGASANFIANLLGPATVQADRETTANVAFGPVNLAGLVTLLRVATDGGMPTPDGGEPPPDGGLVLPDGGIALDGGVLLGVVAARTFSLAQGVQGLVLPVVLLVDPTALPLGSRLTGAYEGQALRANARFSLRLFRGGSAGVTAALQWALNPLSELPAQSTVDVGAGDAGHDFEVTGPW